MTPKIATILAVDDVPDNLFVLESIFADEDNYKLSCVNDGQSALDAVASQPPDLILLDVMMPELDGYEVTRRIRQNKALPYVPILLVTAYDDMSLTEGLDSGADDFIRKPFDLNELLARVRSLIRLKRSMDEQTEMIRQRDDFVARLTHDLRTPLVAANRILTLVHQGAFGEPPKEIGDVLKNIVANNQNLLQMTNTLLQVYRHEAGQKKLVRSPVNMHALATEIVQELKPLADEKQLLLELDAQPANAETKNCENTGQDPYQTQGDTIELRRLLTNLLANAIKFTDKGSVVVRLSPLPDAIEVSVIDTGIGIAEEAQAQIFEWFYQGEHMRAGSGLGLHLAKRIAEMHQGCLTLDSALGQGSTFTLSLPRL